MRIITCFLAVLSFAQHCPVLGEGPFVIHVVDGQTGRGVPLVELTTVNKVTFVTDNAGVVAFDEPGLMNRDVFFHVRSHGYQFPRDGLGFRGRRLWTRPGATAHLKVNRVNIAERLCRLTGSGLYHHSLRAGLKIPLKEPLLNAGVLGSDSVHTSIFAGKLYWLWGDTNRLRYPLGNFDVTMATSPLQGKVESWPEKGVNLTYFEDGKGFVRRMAPMDGKGPTWLTGLCTLKDKNGGEHLVATYAKVRKSMEAYERGLCEFNPSKEIFEKRLTLESPKDLHPGGHPLRHRVGKREWIYCGPSLPNMRFPANYESWLDPGTYEHVKVDEKFTGPNDKTVKRQHGHIAWNPWRKCYVNIFSETWGKPSFLGEIWYAEAPAPEGPWRRAVKILTHDRYSFYNPKQHPYWAGEGGRIIYLEGTYTASFSGNPHHTPRYDYNQLLYRLDLGDTRLKPAHNGSR